MWIQKLKTLLLIGLMIPATSGWAASLVNIENDQAIRANGGSVTIEVESSKPYLLRLNTDVVVVDPKEQVTSHTFSNVDRGTHKVELVSEGNKQTITVHVLRVHQ